VEEATIVIRQVPIVGPACGKQQQERNRSRRVNSESPAAGTPGAGLNDCSCRCIRDRADAAMATIS
jgi:hypothetical protein